MGHHLIESSDFASGTVTLLCRAFDDGWLNIHHRYNCEEVERAREALAKAILSVAHPDSDDADRVKNDALIAMALKLA